MEETKNVFVAKTSDEAIEEGLQTLGITLDEAEITILEEGKKKIFGSVKARVRVEKKRGEGEKTTEFIDGLLAILGIKAVSEDVSEEGSDSVRIDVKTTNSARVIGKRGDVLDAIQTIAGAYANIGRDEYKKVIVDCENYRMQREETLKSLALKLAKSALESGRKMSLEPMTPYERRIIHSTLMDNTEVKTISEGREPLRYIVVIPNNARPGDRGVRYGERRARDGGKRFGGNRSERRERGNGERRDNASRGGRGERRSSGGAKRGKKEIHFGTFLGNSGAQNASEAREDVTVSGGKPQE